jgi:hypothetical protein
MTQIKQINTERQQNTKATINAVIARSVATKQSPTDNASLINASSVKDCFATLAMTARRNAIMGNGNILTTEDTENTEKSPDIVMARCGQLKANKIHFQFSIFNSPLSIKEKGKTCEAVRAGTNFNKSNYMNESFKGIKQYADYSERTMEARAHFKNGANLKSYTSRENNFMSDKGTDVKQM